ncbi:MAG: hypothetical protein ACP5K9_00585 [Candidatus Micrarchaeia archaeon]
MLFGGAFAASFASVLQDYNVPNSLISSLSQHNITYDGMSYAAFYNGTHLYFLINSTDDALVTNATQIFVIIRNYTLQSSISAANFPEIAQMMHSYENSSAPSLNDCLVETGLNRFNCTLSNYCFSCQAVPNCDRVMYQTDGPSGSFGLGIIKFENQYGWLNRSYNAFYSSIQSINISNAQQRLRAIDSSFSNISNLTRSIYQNPIFPPTANITNSQLQSCIYYHTPATSPWYCVALGYCGFLTYNYSQLNGIVARMLQINMLPITDQQIVSIANNASNIESYYITPVLYKRQTSALMRILNTTLANYSSLVSGSMMLLSHVDNITLSSELSTLNQSYNKLLSGYVGMNLTSENATLAKEVAALSGTYSKLNATYSKVLAMASANTALLLKKQLDSMAPSAQLQSLALEEAGLNGMATGKTSNMSYLESSLSSVYSKASAIYTYPSGLTELARSIDTPFVRSMLFSMKLPYFSGVALAPAIASILSILISVIVFALLLFYYQRLRMKRKLRLNRRTERNWHMLFAILGVILIAYIIVGYAYAAAANSFAPYSAFKNAVANSKSVVIAINGTPTVASYQCASMISRSLLAENKTPVIISIINNTCVSGAGTASISDCMNFYATSNIPVIILTNSSSDSINIYSFYGTKMIASGDSAYMAACYPSLLVK